MTQRERTLAFLLLPPLLLFAGGFFAYQLWLEPLRSREKQLVDVAAEIADKEVILKKHLDKKKELDRYKPISLPVETDLAGREYSEELTQLLRESGFDAGTFSITPKVDNKSVPTLGKNKPVYTRLIYTLTAKGELAAVVDFMHRFYKVRLLHQIRNLTLRRPIQSGGANRSNELDVTMTVEALVLDNAEARKTLLPEKTPELPPLLAAEERNYAAIPGKDIFFGPPPPAAPPRAPSATDFAQFIKFDGFTANGSGQTVTLFDAYNKQEVTIRPRADGDGYRVEVYYSVGSRQRSLRSGRTLDVMDEYGELQHRWLVLRVTEREIYLQDEDSYYVVRIGQWLSEMTKLTTEEAAGLGLIAAKPAPSAGKDK